MDPILQRIQDLEYILYNHRHKGYDRTKELDGTSSTTGVQTLIDGPTVDLDASSGDIFYLSAGGNRTINAPTNPTLAKKIIIRHFANGGARTLSLSTGVGGFRFGSDVTGLSSTVSGKTDYIGAEWNEISSTWDVVAVSKGY